MSDIFGFRGGPTYRAATREDMFAAAMDQPMSIGSTFWDQAKGNALESWGLGTVVREMSLPSAAPARWYGDSDESFADRRKGYDTITQDDYKKSAYFREDIPWDAGMTEDRAAALATMYDARKVREFFAEKRPITSFIGGLAGQAVDPINYIPVAGPTVRAAAVAKMGMVKGIAATAALDAAANTAIAGLATRETRRGFGDDVSWQMMVSEIATAALIGSAFGTVGGVLARRAGSRADAMRVEAEGQVQTLKATQEARIALNEAIGGLANDGEVRLSPNAVAPIERQVAAQSSQPELIPTATDRTDIFNVVDDPAQSRSADMVVGDQTFQNTRQIVADIQRTEAEQTKRSALLDDPQKLREYAADKGISEQEMGALIRANYEMNVPRLAALREFAQTSEFKRAEQGQKTKAKAISFNDLSDVVEIDATQIEPIRASTIPNDSSLNRTASWVIRDKATGAAVMETFNPKLAEKVNTAKYEAVPIGQYLGEINGQPKRAVDASPARPDPIPDGRLQAETKIAKPDDYKAMADQYRVDPETGSFNEEAELRQLQTEGRMTDEDIAAMEAADETYQDSSAYAESLRSVVGCLL